MLKSALDAKNLSLIEKVLNFYGASCEDALANQEFVDDLYDYLVARDKHDLFKKAFPSLIKKPDDLIKAEIEESNRGDYRVISPSMRRRLVKV